jgi:hypothetical protein
VNQLLGDIDKLEAENAKLKAALDLLYGKLGKWPQMEGYVEEARRITDE